MSVSSSSGGILIFFATQGSSNEAISNPCRPSVPAQHFTQREQKPHCPS
jgi:hypothetical protein